MFIGGLVVPGREREACASLWESGVGIRYDYPDYATDRPVPLALTKIR